MTYLRHATRHVHQTVLDRIRAGLVTDEWLDVADGAAPFGGDAILWQPRRMKESELLAITTEQSIVAPWFASEPEPEPQELGGGLVMVAHALVIDVIGESDGVSLAITSDIMDRLTGLKPDTSRFEPVYDYSATPRTAVVGYQIEFVNVARSRPEADDMKRTWNVIVADAEVYFTGNE